MCDCASGFLGLDCSIAATGALSADSGAHKMHYAVQSGSVYIMFECTTLGWCGALFGGTGTMINGGDVWMVSVSSGGVASASDRSSVSNVMPPVDGAQNLVDIQGYESGGKTFVQFRRVLDTGDAFDVVIASGAQLAAMAIGGTDDFSVSHGAVNRWPSLSLDFAPCPNGCQVGFGTCVLGKCHCNFGRLGLDCSIAATDTLTADGGNHVMHWKMDSGVAYVALECKTTAWCGVLWGGPAGTMTAGADTWVVSVTNTDDATAEDRLNERIRGNAAH